MHLDKNKLIQSLEDEYSLILTEAGKNKLKVISLIRKEFGFTLLQAKEFIKTEQIIESKVKQVRAEERAKPYIALGASLEFVHTGQDYLSDYDPIRIKAFLAQGDSDIDVSMYYTTPIGCVLYDINDETYAYLIEDDILSKSCCRYLIEKGQVRDN